MHVRDLLGAESADRQDTSSAYGVLLPSWRGAHNSGFGPRWSGCLTWDGGTSRSHNCYFGSLGDKGCSSRKKSLTLKRLDSPLLLTTLLRRNRSWLTKTAHRCFEWPLSSVFTLAFWPLIVCSNIHTQFTILFCRWLFWTSFWVR